VHVEVEFLNDWWLDGERRRESDDRRRRLLDAAAELGAHHVKLGTGGPGDPRDPDRLATELGDLAAAASGAGTHLAIETGAGSALDLARDVLPAVRLVSDRAVGVMLDPWHFVRTDTPYSVIDGIAPSEIVAVELSDGESQMVGSFFDDTFDRRLLPGDGDFAVADFVRAVTGTGWTGVWGVEVMSDTLRGLPVPVVLHQAFTAATTVLDPPLARPSS
jgi:sugar phosphate isomerase/epimerase